MSRTSGAPTTWIALLRGVNVGGVTIRNAELAAVFRDLGVDGVKTVLASGNVRFEADARRTVLKARIEAALRERFGYEAWIALVTLDELEKAIAGFPFDADDSSRQPYVLFCGDDAVRAEIIEAAGALDPDEDRVRDGPGVVYWSVQKGRTLDTPFGKLLGRARYKATTTTRNLRTLAKLVG
ncbi:MAG: DUF1697 domain-containing protein [Microbacterium sp.]